MHYGHHRSSSSIVGPTIDSEKSAPLLRRRRSSFALATSPPMSHCRCSNRRLSANSGRFLPFLLLALRIYFTAVLMTLPSIQHQHQLEKTMALEEKEEKATRTSDNYFAAQYDRHQHSSASYQKYFISRVLGVNFPLTRMVCALYGFEVLCVHSGRRDGTRIVISFLEIISKKMV